jgi:hypothetical protein
MPFWGVTPLIVNQILSISQEVVVRSRESGCHIFMIHQICHSS